MSQKEAFEEKFLWGGWQNNVPSKGGKHIFKILVSCRMEKQQNLKAVWKILENIMTIDEEMKDLSAKAAKASRKEENCKNDVQFSNAFCNQALSR